jgi:NAD(P)-dependent dehydrogenase (short-subunit alcohol dehydrogenase family)
MQISEKVVIIGGSSGIGLAVARSCLHHGASVVLCGRSADRLADASADLGAGDRVRVAELDVTDPVSAGELFHSLGGFSHLVVTAADLPVAPVSNLTQDQVIRAVRSKIIGPLFAAQQAVAWMPDRGSITFTSGIAAARPMPGGSLAAIANGALNSMVRALALELAPVRVNAISPGWVDTPIWDRMLDPAQKRERFDAMSARLPGKRIAHPNDVADGILFLINSGFATGTVLHVEGGQELV